jgi:penicillin-binding protein 1A
MHPVVARAALRAAELARGLGQVIRRRPVLAASFLPLLVLLYVLALVPFTPGIGDLSKAKSEVPAVVVSADGADRAAGRRAPRGAAGAQVADRVG